MNLQFGNKKELNTNIQQNMSYLEQQILGIAKFRLSPVYKTKNHLFQSLNEAMKQKTKIKSQASSKESLKDVRYSQLQHPKIQNIQINKNQENFRQKLGVSSTLKRLVVENERSKRKLIRYKERSLQGCRKNSQTIDVSELVTSLKRNRFNKKIALDIRQKRNAFSHQKDEQNDFLNISNAKKFPKKVEKRKINWNTLAEEMEMKEQPQKVSVRKQTLKNRLKVKRHQEQYSPWQLPPQTSDGFE